MSKIFDAYKKRVGESVDVTLGIGQVGSLALFPPPEGKQKTDFNNLANRILGLRLDSRGSVISFASVASGEGTSFVSFQTAQYLAQAYHQKVCWIDGNFLSPQPKLRGRDRPTFASLLQDPDLVNNLVLDTNPYLIGAGQNLLSAKGHLADEKYRELLGLLARKFDFVILDQPPVLETSDSALMASGADGVILVIQHKFLKHEILQHGIDELADKGVQVLGSVINRRDFGLPKIIYDRL